MLDLDGGKKRFMFLISLVICRVLLVKILKCSHLFRTGDVCAQVIGYVQIHI